MKELETHHHINNGHRVELNVKKKQEVEHVLQGTIKPRDGHFIWELNEESGEIKKAVFKTTVAVLGAKVPTQELVVNKDCIYIPALNAENAKKKYLKNKEQSFYFVKEAPMSLSEITFK